MTAFSERAAKHRSLWINDRGIVPVIIVLFIALTLFAPNFFSSANFLNILDQNAPLMLVAMGTTFVIIAGGFDLSSGQILSLCGVLGAKFALVFQNPFLGVVLAILMGIPIGMVNGLLVGRLKVNSFLATLATGFVMGGLALAVTQGFSLDLSSSANFGFLGAGRVGSIPNSVILCVVAFLVLGLVLSRTVFGRHVLAVGSNPESARLSGVPVERIRVVVFAIGGLLAAMGGLVVVTRTGVGNVYGSANSITLSAIAAVVIGGTSIRGGRGAIWRTVLGVLLLALLQNAFNLMSIQPYWQQIVSGLIILGAVILNTKSSRE
ncbi:MAG: ABC transporter permease [Actinobacteria bacterium]|jgi:ribose transport system permease protein|nr:ABC transporter permease [Actinomycetota bacterium]